MIGDRDVETDEFFRFRLHSPALNATLGEVNRVVRIDDDDVPPPVPAARVETVRGVVLEGDPPASNRSAAFDIVLDRPTTVPVTIGFVTYSTGFEHPATPNEDYRTQEGAVTFEPGATRRRVEVPIISDIRVERDEQFGFRIRNPHEAIIGTIDRQTARIEDDDHEVELPVLNVERTVRAVSEGDEGVQDVTFRLTLSRPTNETVVVRAITSVRDLERPATPGEDFHALERRFEFAPGQTVVEVHVAVIGDRQVEADEQFALFLRDAVNERIGESRAIVRIEDDDRERPTLPLLDVFSPERSIREGDDGHRLAVFEIRLSRESAETVRVNYATHTDLSAPRATAGVDFEARSGVAEFPAGRTRVFIEVPVLGDTVPETDEFFGLRIGEAVNATIHERSGTARIDDDDHARVADRHIFFNESHFDGEDAAASELDDNAIAPEKSALLPEQRASRENYTNYNKGINGIMVDLAASPHPGAIGPEDFEFRVGRLGSPNTWERAPDPVSITLRAGAGVDHSDRLTIIFPNGSIVNEWLRVVVKANERTGLERPDIHYWGNQQGDTGNSDQQTGVDAFDRAYVRDNSRSADDRVPITNPLDMNKDSLVDFADLGGVRDSQTTFNETLTLREFHEEVSGPPVFALVSETSADDELTSAIESDVTVPTPIFEAFAPAPRRDDSDGSYDTIEEASVEPLESLIELISADIARQ